jgi:hypothetical protein
VDAGTDGSLTNGAGTVIATELSLARWEGEGGAVEMRLAAPQGTLTLTGTDDEEHTRADEQKVSQAAEKVARDDGDDPNDE